MGTAVAEGEVAGVLPTPARHSAFRLRYFRRQKGRLEGSTMERMLSIVDARKLMIERWDRYVSVRTLARWAASDLIPEAEKVGKTWVIPESALERVAKTVGRDSQQDR
jgi:hypothetical protein